MQSNTLKRSFQLLYEEEIIRENIQQDQLGIIWSDPGENDLRGGFDWGVTLEGNKRSFFFFFKREILRIGTNW